MFLCVCVSCIGFLGVVVGLLLLSVVSAVSGQRRVYVYDHGLCLLYDPTPPTLLVVCVVDLRYVLEMVYSVLFVHVVCCVSYW